MTESCTSSDSTPLPHRIDVEASCAAPVEEAFAYVADYRTIPSWMLGVRRLEPVTAQERGCGAEYDVSLQLGVPLRLRLRTVEYDENRALGMDSVKGFRARSRWYFSPEGPDRTTVRATVSYDLPFGPAGRALGRAIEPFARQAVTHISTHLRRNIEAQVG
jgi:uncharacterized membrane protein